MSSAFAFAADAAAGAEGDVAAVEPGELADAQPGLHGDEQQRPVASTFPACRVGGGEEGVDLDGGEERHGRPVEPFRWDGQHPLDQQGVFGVAQRGVGEQRPDGGEAQVAGPRAVVALGFEVIEEGADHLGVEVVPVDAAWRLAGAVVDEHDEQPQRVPVGGDRAGAGPALFGEPVGEEALQGGRDQAHRLTAAAEASSLPAARASSSGAADRYQ